MSDHDPTTCEDYRKPRVPFDPGQRITTRPLWACFEREAPEHGGGLVEIARGSKEDMQKYARKGGVALRLA